MTKKVEKIEENERDLNLLQKINCIRKAWGETQLSKEGAGKAGGGAKYDYYKPQQIIDFCLEQELLHELFSEFKIDEQRGMCFYNVIDIPTGEIKGTECPFEVPRKMAASEAQQVGAAMTYFNRRLAMMLYKIEDNSKESVSVVGDADYTTARGIPAPSIPAPPMTEKVIVPPPPVAPPVQAEAIKDDREEDKMTTEEIIKEVEVAFNLPPEGDTNIVEAPKEPVATPPPLPPSPPKITPPPAVEPPKVTTKEVVQEALKTEEPTPQKVGKQSIEALYD